QDRGSLSTRTDAPRLPATDRVPNSNPLRPKILLVAADAATLAATGVIAAGIFDATVGDSAAARRLLVAMLATLPVWIGLFSNQRLYNTRFIGRRIDEFRRIVNASVLGTLAVTVAGSMANVLLPRSGLVLLAVTAGVCITI